MFLVSLLAAGAGMLLPVLLVLPLLRLDPVYFDWIRHGLALICIWLLTLFQGQTVSHMPHW